MRSAGRPARDAGAVEFARPPWATIAIARAAPAGDSVHTEGDVPVSVIPGEASEWSSTAAIPDVRRHPADRFPQSAESPTGGVAAAPDRPYARRVFSDHEGTSELCPEPLLLSSLIDVHSGSPAGSGAILEIMRGLMESPRTDAERAGEQLAVFGWQVEGPDHTLRWIYRIVGRDTGEEHARFILAVPWAPSDLSLPPARAAAADHAERGRERVERRARRLPRARPGHSQLTRRGR